MYSYPKSNPNWMEKTSMQLETWGFLNIGVTCDNPLVKALNPFAFGIIFVIISDLHPSTVSTSSSFTSKVILKTLKVYKN